jgi:hypothetical protein
MLKVVLLLMTLGAVAGAAMGSLLLLGFALFGPSFVNGPPLYGYGYAALLGAGVGAVSGPAIALTLLRKVPIWRATTETAAAAGIGSALGGLTLTRVPFAWAYGALFFAILAALRLRRAYEKRAEPVASQNS